MKQKYAEAHKASAEVYAKLSSAKRLNVGCVIVKDNTIIGIGYNGMPSGWTNECENKDYMSVDAGGWLNPDEIEKRWPFKEEVKGDEEPLEYTYTRRYALKTKPEVLHAENNANAKVSRSTNPSESATLFVTHAPCLDCAKLIYQSGINSVYYRNTYRDESGVNFLKQCGVEVNHV